MFLRIKIATDSNARHRVRVEQTFDEEPCFERLPLSFLGGKELPLHECPAGVGGRCPIPLNGNRTRRTKMQIDEVEWRAVWSRDARIKERPVPSQATRNFPDERAEYLINDRLSFMRFLGPGLSDRIPDARTIWLVPGETADVPAGGTALIILLISP